MFSCPVVDGGCLSSREMGRGVNYTVPKSTKCVATMSHSVHTSFPSQDPQILHENRLYFSVVKIHPSTGSVHLVMNMKEYPLLTVWPIFKFLSDQLLARI